MKNNWTVSEVMELQNQQKQLNQRLEIHKERAKAKQEELQKLLQQANVTTVDELKSLCTNLNNAMQSYANEIEQKVSSMKEKCDELDAML